MYKVFQIKLPREVIDYVNSNDRGHLGGEEKYPIYEVRMRLQHGSRRDKDSFRDTDFGHFTHVASVKKDAGLVDGDGNSWLIDDLEGVFAVLNGRYYDEDTEKDIVFDAHVSDYKMKTVTRKNGEVVTFRDMHSLSVGDIVEDTDAGTFQMVDSYGFKDVTEQVKNFFEISEVA